MLFENIMVRDISQSKKAKNHVISHMWDIKLKLIGTDNSTVGTGGWGSGAWVVKVKGAECVVTVAGGHTVWYTDDVS